MKNENKKFVVLYLVRYFFDTKEEADKFVKFNKGHCDGCAVVSLDEDVKNEQK